MKFSRKKTKLVSHALTIWIIVLFIICLINALSRNVSRLVLNALIMNYLIIDRTTIYIYYYMPK